MAYVEKLKNAELHAVFGPYALAQKFAGITKFGHTSERQVNRRGAQNFGGLGPVAIDDMYLGESGSIEYEGLNADNILQALLNGADPATWVVDNAKNNFPLYLVCNVFDEDGTTPLLSRFVSYAVFENKARQVGPDARSLNFQAMWAKEFKGKKIAIDVFTGNATPVTALTLAAAAYQDASDSNKIALAVLRQTQNTKTVKPLALTTDYTETTSAITLLTGLGATEKGLVISVVA
jgi:hypothetical protein